VQIKKYFYIIFHASFEKYFPLFLSQAADLKAIIMPLRARGRDGQRAAAAARDH
jgi:hypothetical protein